ncbi:MAG: GNAT family N-acetyltransferase [Butyrivibrio sp.]|nr:GNAT family N-acetyltransferase [Butyrivibrio sp.]
MPSTTACMRIALPEEALSKLFPIGSHYLDQDRLYAYGIVDDSDKKLMGLAIYTLSEDLPGAADLVSFFIYEKFRGWGYGKELLEKSLESLKSAGVKYVVYREVSGDSAELLSGYNFATKQGFVPVVIDEKILYYGVGRLLGGKFSRLVPKMRDSLENVVKLGGPKDERIGRLNEREDLGLFKIRSEFDDDLSGFYLNDMGEIIGAAKAYREGKKVMVNNIFTDPECDKREVFTALTVKLGVNVTMDPGIEEVVFQSVGDDRYSEFANLFGKADKEYQAIELVLYL